MKNEKELSAPLVGAAINHPCLFDFPHKRMSYTVRHTTGSIKTYVMVMAVYEKGGKVLTEHRDIYGLTTTDLDTDFYCEDLGITIDNEIYRLTPHEAYLIRRLLYGGFKEGVSIIDDTENINNLVEEPIWK